MTVEEICSGKIKIFFEDVEGKSPCGQVDLLKELDS
jgi:hypothetical protein